MLKTNPYKIFYDWLLLAGAMFFALYLIWDFGFLQRIINSDVTRISVVILLIFVLSSLYCAWRSYFLAEQTRLSLCIEPADKSISLVKEYLRSRAQADKSDSTILTEVLAENLRGSHQVGWFFAALLIKLGLLGTVVGFVIMLGSISTMETLAVDDIQQLMQQMTAGMGVAMNTTMVGLVCSMLLGLQYLLLDRGADRLLVRAVELAQSQQNSL